MILGYSVPTKYGKTEVPLEEFHGWPIHLLGGSPQKQMELFQYFRQHSTKVVSVDGNVIGKLSMLGQFWRDGCWFFLKEEPEYQGFLVQEELNIAHFCFELSVRNVQKAWKELYGGF